MKKIIILIPIFNDWQSVFKLLENINTEVSNLEDETIDIDQDSEKTKSTKEEKNNEQK